MLFVMAFTSGYSSAGTNDSPYISIHLRNGDEAERRLYDRPGDDMARNKGDLWSFPISNFNFRRTHCVSKRDISHVIIREGGNDGWNIESIVTVLEYPRYRYDVVSADFNVNRWIDGDDQNDEHRRYSLRIV